MMKNFKSLLVLILMIITCVITLTACNDDSKTQNEPTHQHSYVEGKCECGEEDPNYVAPHTHNFVEGKCECGEEDPNYVPPHTHKFVDGSCECGETYVAPLSGWTLVTEIKNGDNVLIAAPAYNKLLSAEKVSASSYYNKGVNYTTDDYSNVTDAEIFVVTVNADGSYTFTSLTGVVIALAADYASLNNDGVNKSWELIEKSAGVFYLKNTVRGNYLEWYDSKGNWSTYATTSLSDLFELSFYAKVESSDSEHVHNHISSVHAATCEEAGYTAYTCSCGDTYTIAGEAATGHQYTPEVIAPTCEEAGYTKHTCTCGDSYTTDEVAALGHKYTTEVIDPTCVEVGYTKHTCTCGHSYTSDEVAALGHSFADGVCGVCGETNSGDEEPVTTGSADFNTIELPSNKPNGDSSYTNTYTTANGWVTNYSAIQTGGASVMNPQFPVIGSDNTSKAVCLNGKVGATGKITSPTLNGGLSVITIKYTKMFTDTELSATITVTELSTGNVYTHVFENRGLSKDEKYVVYTAEWVLETPVTGDFTIEILNNCPTGATGNKDRLTVLSIDWKGAAQVHTHSYVEEITTAATCTVEGLATFTCSCGESYTEVIPMADHVDTNLDITCDFEGCTKRILPAADSKVSLFTARHMIVVSLSNSYYMEGVVTEVKDAYNGIFVITDAAGDSVLVRLPKDADGNSYASWTTLKVVLGDTICLYGKPTKNTDTNTLSTYPAKVESAVLTVVSHEHNFSAPTCTLPATCGCLAVGDAALGHTDGNKDYLCDVCEWDVSLLLSDIAISTDGTTNGVLDANKTSWTWGNEEFNVVVAKGTSSSSLYTSAKAYMQFKKLNTLTVSSKNGALISLITITATNPSQFANLKGAVGTAYEYTEDEATLSITIKWNSTNDFVLVNNSSATVYVDNVSVAYATKDVVKLDGKMNDLIWTETAQVNKLVFNRNTNDVLINVYASRNSLGIYLYVEYQTTTDYSSRTDWWRGNNVEFRFNGVSGQLANLTGDPSNRTQWWVSNINGGCGNFTSQYVSAAKLNDSTGMYEIVFEIFASYEQMGVAADALIGFSLGSNDGGEKWYNSVNWNTSNLLDSYKIHEEGITMYFPEEVCGGNHQYGDFIVEVQASCSADGEQAKYCKWCNHRVAEGIAKGDHSFDQNKLVYTVVPTCMNTGSGYIECNGGCGLREEYTFSKDPFNHVNCEKEDLGVTDNVNRWTAGGWTEESTWSHLAYNLEGDFQVVTTIKLQTNDIASGWWKGILPIVQHQLEEGSGSGSVWVTRFDWWGWCDQWSSGDKLTNNFNDMAETAGNRDIWWTDSNGNNVTEAQFFAGMTDSTIEWTCTRMGNLVRNDFKITTAAGEVFTYWSVAPDVAEGKVLSLHLVSEFANYQVISVVKHK